MVGNRRLTGNDTLFDAATILFIRERDPVSHPCPISSFLISRI